MITRIEHNQPSNVLRIEYMLGNTCNQKCSYCFPGCNDGTVDFPDLEIVKTNLKRVLDHYLKNGKDTFNFYMVGGEPTLWDDFLPLCEWLASNYNTVIEISTNATRGILWWQKAARVIDHINISVHHEYAKVNKIMKLADYLYSAGKFVNVDVLMDPDNFEKCENIVELYTTMSINKWPLVAKSVLYNGQTRYTIDQLKYFEDPVKQYPDKSWFEATVKKPRTQIKIYGDEITTTNNDGYIIQNNLNYFKGWMCNLGVDHVVISGSGTLKGNCGQILFEKEYNLYDKDFVFEPKIQPTVCKQQICNCSGETMITKWKA